MGLLNLLRLKVILMAKEIDMREIAAAAKARLAAKKQGAGLTSAAPLTGPDDARTISDLPVPKATPPRDGDTVRTPVPNGSGAPTVVQDLSGRARESVNAPDVLVVTTTASGTKTPGPAPVTVVPEVAAKPVDTKPSLPAPESTGQVLQFPTSEPSAQTDAQSRAPVDKPETGSASEKLLESPPKVKPKSIYTLEEASAEIQRQLELIGKLFNLVVGDLAGDNLEKAIQVLRGAGGLVAIMDDLTTVVVGKHAEKDLGPFAQAVRKGAPGLLDEMAYQSHDHAEILRNTVIGFLLNPDLDSEELAAFAKERGEDHVKDAITGLIADPNIIRSVLISEAATRNGIEPSQVAEPGDDTVAKSASEWVEAQVSAFMTAAQTCIECWDQIIGGD